MGGHRINKALEQQASFLSFFNICGECVWATLQFHCGRKTHPCDENKNKKYIWSVGHERFYGNNENLFPEKKKSDNGKSRRCVTMLTRWHLNMDSSSQNFIFFYGERKRNYIRAAGSYRNTLEHIQVGNMPPPEETSYPRGIRNLLKVRPAGYCHTKDALSFEIPGTIC